MTSMVTKSRSQTGIVTQVPPQDPRLIRRIVGFHEYATSLSMLDEFVKHATEQEMAAAEEIVRSRRELAVETNLSRHIQGATFFAESAHDKDDFRRVGLAWVMALARVEVGAMLAGFSSHHQPFKASQPTKFETEAFRELLSDGMRTHYWSLKNDPVIRSYLKTGVPPQHIITYGRRVSVARHFMQAVREFSRSQLLAIQKAELAAEDAEMKSLQVVYIYCLAKKQIGQTADATFNHSFAACPPLMDAAKREYGKGSSRTSLKFGSRLEELLVRIEPRLIAIPCR